MRPAVVVKLTLHCGIGLGFSENTYHIYTPTRCVLRFFCFTRVAIVKNAAGQVGPGGAVHWRWGLRVDPGTGRLGSATLGILELWSCCLRVFFCLFCVYGDKQ